MSQPIPPLTDEGRPLWMQRRPETVEEIDLLERLESYEALLSRKQSDLAQIVQTYEAMIKPLEADIEDLKSLILSLKEYRFALQEGQP